MIIDQGLLLESRLLCLLAGAGLYWGLGRGLREQVRKVTSEFILQHLHSPPYRLHFLVQLHLITATPASAKIARINTKVTQWLLLIKIVSSIMILKRYKHTTVYPLLTTTYFQLKSTEPSCKSSLVGQADPERKSRIAKKHRAFKTVIVVPKLNSLIKKTISLTQFSENIRDAENQFKEQFGKVLYCEKKPVNPRRKISNKAALSTSISNYGSTLSQKVPYSKVLRPQSVNVRRQCQQEDRTSICSISGWHNANQQQRII